jgi:Xaa-Pro aminopeptidase
MMANVGGPFALEGNFASGPRTLANEPPATNRQLQAGDVIFIDLYPIIHGNAADLTRSFIVGKPSEAQLERHEVLKNALAAGVDALNPGVRACDVDRAVRSSIATALGGYTFPRHAGHALVLEAQERPMLVPGDNTIIEPGMAVAIEPGPYLPDLGGMRVEGNYLVTETGCMSLSDYPIELFGCG